MPTIELRALQAKRVQLATIDTLLRAVREAIEPRASEAVAWVAERPRRTAVSPCARARFRATTFRPLSGAQYDTLIAGASVGKLPAAVGAAPRADRMYLDATAISAGARELRDVLRATPADTAMRHELAVLLLDGRSTIEGRAQYDTLIATAPTAGPLHGASAAASRDGRYQRGRIRPGRVDLTRRDGDRPTSRSATCIATAATTQRRAHVSRCARWSERCSRMRDFP